MIKIKFKITSILFIFCLGFGFATKAQSSELVTEFVSDLNQKGVNVVDAKGKVYETDDYSKMNQVNFNQYRMPTKRKLVQIENGPLLELLSLAELERNQISVSEAEKQAILQKDENYVHETIPLLRLGLGIKPAPEPK